jgi:hypothetical protein
MCAPAFAEEDKKPAAERRLEFAQQSAAKYRFRLDRKNPPQVKLQPRPLLRWNNQIVREDDGMLFLWTEGDKGRPVAAAQFFLVETVWNHEFQSLSPHGFEARFAGEEAGRGSWQPARAGVSLAMADNIESPAETPNQRLRQMKTIAERFTAAVDPDGRFDSPEELRLLTTPIYRYSATDDGVLDGAIFVFAQGTNPEVMLLIEADTDKSVWRYGFARMSCFHLRVRRDNQIVWQRDRAPVPTSDRASTYFFRLNAEIDASGEIEIPPTKK